MEVKTVYFSYAYTTPELTSSLIKEKLSNIGVGITYYVRGTVYSDDPIKNCDVFVMCLPDNSVETPVSKLSAGLQKELVLAHRLKKDIILANITDNLFEVEFYLVEIDNGKVRSIAESHNDVIKLLSEEKKVELNSENDSSNELDWLLNNPNKDKINIIL